MLRFVSAAFLSASMAIALLASPPAHAGKAKSKVTRNIASLVSAQCDRARERCGSMCNTEAGDDDAAWNKCFPKCLKGENPACAEPEKKNCGERTREQCGSRCNTDAGDDERKWNSCFDKCVNDC